MAECGEMLRGCAFATAANTKRYPVNRLEPEERNHAVAYSVKKLGECRSGK
jgi:hypothetical protein